MQLEAPMHRSVWLVGFAGFLVSGMLIGGQEMVEDADGMTPLLRASASGQLADATKLATSPEVVNYRTKRDGLTPLMIAAFCGQSAIVEMLLAKGADVMAVDGGRQNNVVDYASSGGHVEIAKLLMAKGAKLNPPQGAMALMFSVGSMPLDRMKAAGGVACKQGSASK
jgi:hypothetical protein